MSTFIVPGEKLKELVERGQLIGGVSREEAEEIGFPVDREPFGPEPVEEDGEE